MHLNNSRMLRNKKTMSVSRLLSSSLFIILRGAITAADPSSNFPIPHLPLPLSFLLYHFLRSIAQSSYFQRTPSLSLPHLRLLPPEPSTTKAAAFSRAPRAIAVAVQCSRVITTESQESFISCTRGRESCAQVFLPGNLLRL